MNSSISFRLSIVLLFTSVMASAQKDILKIKPLEFVSQQAVNYSLITFDNFVSQKLPKPFDKEVHYSAFFCKMELKALDHYNVWIKVHAGDYDRYSRVYIPQ